METAEMNPCADRTHRKTIDRRQATKLMAATGLAMSGWTGCRADSDRHLTNAEVLVVNGTMVTAAATRTGDLRIKGERIVEIGDELRPHTPSATVIDAGGKLITPGGVDPHVHLSKPWVDDFVSGSMAALAGGVTSLGHMVFPARDQSITRTMEEVGQRVQRAAIADVFLHAVALSPGDVGIADLKQLADSGHTSVKFFMVAREFANSLAAVDELIRGAGRLGMMSLMHAEAKAVLDSAIEQLKRSGQTSLRYYAASRPVEAEIQATRHAIDICRNTGSPIYLVHLSSGEALRLCHQARDAGLPVFVETRPMYLHLTDEVLATPTGPLFVGMPPLRKQVDVDALWKGMAKGTIQTLATDHAPWTREQKMDAAQTIETPNGGVNNLQVMLPMLMSEGVRTNRITLQQFVQLTSTHAAKLFGLYPQKGEIAVGSDADLVVWDTSAARVVDGSQGYSKAGYSIYDGTTVTGWPTHTIRRGRIVYQDGSIAERPDHGKLLLRRPQSRSGPNI